MPAFQPADLRVEPIPFVGTFDRSESEVAAALFVRLRVFLGLGWDDTINFEEIPNLIKGDEIMRRIDANPFLRPDVKGLFEGGFIDDDYRFTELGYERLAKWVIK